MEPIKSAFTTYQFDVEVITPVHVGMAQEKNYIRGLDYVLAGDELWLINNDLLFKELTEIELANLSGKLAEGNTKNLEPLLKNLLKGNPKALLQRIAIQGEPSDGTIRRLYRTGLGSYALPGSSIKGAIRSILLAKLKITNGSDLHNDELDKLMGGIGNNLMRYMQVGDVSLPKESIAIRRTKIFSADSQAKGVNERGEWKHGFTQGGNGKHSPKFLDPKYGADAFVTFYELATPDFLPEEPPVLTIRLGSHLPHDLGRYVTGYQQTDFVRKANVPNYNELLKGTDGQWLINTIKAHTKRYLEREKDFFQKFFNADLDTPVPVLNSISDLLKLNDQPDSCLLRVGAGVGFHSITGDWQQRSQDHVSEWVINKNQIFAKTRKFSFTQDGGEFDFALMGFLKLTLQTPESVAARQQKLEATRARITKEASDAEIKRIAEEAERQLQIEEAKKPKMYVGAVSKGLELDAEVIVAARINKVKVYAAGYESKTFDLIGYLNPLTVGTIVIVKADQLNGKKQLLQVRYVRPK